MCPHDLCVFTRSPHTISAIKRPLRLRCTSQLLTPFSITSPYPILSHPFLTYYCYHLPLISRRIALHPTMYNLHCRVTIVFRLVLQSLTMFTVPSIAHDTYPDASPIQLPHPTVVIGPQVSASPQFYPQFSDRYISSSTDVEWTHAPTLDYSDLPSTSWEPSNSLEPQLTDIPTTAAPTNPPRRPYPPAACQCLMSGLNCNASVAAVSVVCQPSLPPLSQSYDCHWNCCLVCIFNPSWSPCLEPPLLSICDSVLFNALSL